MDTKSLCEAFGWRLIFEVRFGYVNARLVWWERFRCPYFNISRAQRWGREISAFLGPLWFLADVGTHRNRTFQDFAWGALKHPDPEEWAG